MEMQAVQEKLPHPSEMQNEELYQITKENKLPLVTVIRYLNIYVAQLNTWDHYIYRVNQKWGKYKDMKELLSCAILLPAVDNSQKIPANPGNYLLQIPYFHQLEEREWFPMLQKTFLEDTEIDLRRIQLLCLGIISPWDLAILTRQAHNWLYETFSAKLGTKPNADQINRIDTLINIYGGQVICSMFTRYKSNIDLVNWNTCYFFERAIHRSFTMDQLLKIKTQELQKTNKKLVKSVRLA